MIDRPRPRANGAITSGCAGARKSSRSSANRNPSKPYSPPAPWNGKPSRTNRAEPRRLLRRSWYARCPRPLCVPPSLGSVKILSGDLAESPVGGSRAFLGCRICASCLRGHRTPTAATTLGAIWRPCRLALGGPGQRPGPSRVSPPAELQNPCSLSSQHGLSS